MPISREAFQVRISGDQGDVTEEFADALETGAGASNARRTESIDKGAVESAAESDNDSGSHSAEDARAKESPQEVRKEGSPNLPPADPTSAEKKEAFGAAHPERETRRSVATGRDVPQFTQRPQERERMEFNWDEARSQAGVYEQRARSQRDAAAEHLARIHDIVELLIEMSEAHSNDGERKLQSLEGKVAEMETRMAVNRSSP